jgi:hypothetical protein
MDSDDICLARWLVTESCIVQAVKWLAMSWTILVRFPAGARIFLFATASSPALILSQPLIRCLTEDYLPIRRAVTSKWLRSLPGVEVNNAWSFNFSLFAPSAATLLTYCDPSKLTGMNHFCVEQQYNLLQHYLCKSHWKYKHYNISFQLK